MPEPLSSKGIYAYICIDAGQSGQFQQFANVDGIAKTLQVIMKLLPATMQLSFTEDGYLGATQMAD